MCILCCSLCTHYIHCSLSTPRERSSSAVLHRVFTGPIWGFWDRGYCMCEALLGKQVICDLNGWWLLLPGSCLTSTAIIISSHITVTINQRYLKSLGSAFPPYRFLWFCVTSTTIVIIISSHITIADTITCFDIIAIPLHQLQLLLLVIINHHVAYYYESFLSYALK